jgi:hypothetical protein
MSISYPYYLPLAADLYQGVRFLSITPKRDGLGESATQKIDKDGTPVWVLSALVKYQDAAQETQEFSLTAPSNVAEEIAKIPELTPIGLKGLSGGKWSKATTDKTSWSFHILGITVAK